jgi:hypothetical protein
LEGGEVMTKVSAKQLELTANKTREELLVQALPSHIDPESPAFKADLAKIEKIEKAEAAQAVLAHAVPSDNGEDFDWDTDDAVILKEQRATAVYHNRRGELIIRQRAAWDDEGDTFVYITPDNVVAFLEGAAKQARE